MANVMGPLATVMIGRQEEVRRCDDALTLARAGVGQVVLIAGEAGVGKSRLVRAIRERASALADLTWVEGYCADEEPAVPYGPFRDVVRGLVRVEGAAAVATVGPLAAELARLVPELAGIAQAPPAIDEPQVAKRRLFEAITAVCCPTAEHVVRVIVLEDVHWIDRTSADLIVYLARAITRERVLLFGTYRPDEVEARPALTRLLVELNRERRATEVRLEPLALADLATLLETMLRRSLPVGFVEALYDRTGGNPFVAEEILKSLIETDALDRLIDQTRRGRAVDLSVMPLSVRESILRRTARLDMVSAATLRHAAVLGRRFDYALLLDLAGCDEAELLRRLRALVAAQMVIEESDDTVAFRHALTHRVVYGDLLARERRLLHGEALVAMEQRYAGVLDAHLADLAYHAYQAGVWQAAFQYARRAGAVARDVHAPRAAVEQFTRALASADRIVPPPLVAEMITLYRDRGQAHELVGDFDAAHADYEMAMRQAAMAADGRGEWRAALDLGLLWAGRDYAEAGHWYERALAHARAVGEPTLLAHSLNRVGNWHLNREQPMQARRLHREALAIFERLSDRSGAAETLDLLGVTELLCGDLVASAIAYRQAVALFEELDDRRGLASSLAVLVTIAGTYHIDFVVPAVTRLAEAEAYGERARQVARAIQWRAGEAFALLCLGSCLGPRGDYARALTFLRQGRAIADEIEHRQWMTFARYMLGALAIDLLALPAAVADLEQALALARELAAPQWVDCVIASLARARIQQGDFRRAAALLGDAAASPCPGQTIAQRQIWHARAELVLAEGDPATALSIADDLLAAAPNGGPLPNGVGMIPGLVLLRGEALFAAGRVVDAEAAVRAARDRSEASGLRSLLWRSQIALGRLYRAQRRREEAGAAFTAARALVAELAAGVPDADLQAQFIQGVAALLPAPRPPTRLQAAKAAHAGLTARERDVAVLIGQGLSNRTIAHRLSLSERTVATHVGNILAKLDMATRAQVAVWAYGAGLTRPSDDSDERGRGVFSVSVPRLSEKFVIARVRNHVLLTTRGQFRAPRVWS